MSRRRARRMTPPNTIRHARARVTFDPDPRSSTPFEGPHRQAPALLSRADQTVDHVGAKLRVREAILYRALSARRAATPAAARAAATIHVLGADDPRRRRGGHDGHGAVPLDLDHGQAPGGPQGGGAVGAGRERPRRGSDVQGVPAAVARAVPERRNHPLRGAHRGGSGAEQEATEPADAEEDAGEGAVEKSRGRATNERAWPSPSASPRVPPRTTR